MTATNHALAGAALGLVVQQPLLALPLAFLSHFVLDALPHYGPGKNDIGSSVFRWRLVADAALCVLLVLLLAVFHPTGWLVAAVCAFVATSPDLMWLRNFRREQAGKEGPKISERAIVVRFHAFIQWFERPIGAFVEVAWFASGIAVLAVLVTSGK